MYKNSFPKKNTKTKQFCKDYMHVLGNFLDNFNNNLDKATKLIEKTILNKKQFLFVVMEVHLR